MALIRCPECGKEISDSAKFCPHCGYKEKKKLSKNAFIAIVCVMVALALTGSLFAIIHFKKDKKEITSESDVTTESKSKTEEISELVTETISEISDDLSTEENIKKEARHHKGQRRNILTGQQ